MYSCRARPRSHSRYGIGPLPFSRCCGLIPGGDDVQVDNVVITTEDEQERLGDIRELPFGRGAIWLLSLNSLPSFPVGTPGQPVSTFEKLRVDLGCEFVPLEGLPFEPIRSSLWQRSL
eukprot:m.109845 g.109845  ORF g.109845 m.109845 type:complete len:118 (+) comp51787_c0_seq2:21-374(+)